MTKSNSNTNTKSNNKSKTKTKNVVLGKLNKSKQEELKNSIESNFNLKNFQTYFPAMTYWEDFDNNNYFKQLFVLNSKYQLTRLDKKIEKNEDSNSNPNFNFDFLGYIKKKDSDSLQKSEIHFKINPLLEPTNVMMNEYKLQSSGLMPNIFDYLTNKKINSPHNFSYVETLFAYLASGLVEKGKCPSFPYFYGSYLGMVDEFKHDISDEYDSMKRYSWFKENKDKFFTVEKISITDGIPELPDIDPEEQTTKDLTLGAEPIDFDSFDINDKSMNIVKRKRRNSNQESDSDLESIENIDDLNIEELKDEEDEEDEGDEGDEGDDEGDEGDDEGDESEWETESEDEKDCNSEDDDDDSNGDEEDINDVDLDEKSYYVKLNDFPVQLIAMEKMSMTLDELLKEKKISEHEWLSILFQVIFGLAVAQKHFKFTHNDLHSSNIMLKPTKIPYLYFAVKGTYYKIPTFGKITKIIDFARAVFTVDGIQFFSDVFKPNGDAGGQYTYPYTANTKIKHAPNPSFDLSYLAITISEHFNHQSPIASLLEKWTTDKYGNNLQTNELSFDLYVKIAHNVNSAIPYKQFNDALFYQFKIKKDKIPQGSYIYYF
jgi:hypothetical protein